MKRQCLAFAILPLIGLIFFSTGAEAADRYSVASGNWSNSGTWSAARGGAPGASVPTAADNVFIDNGYTVSVDLSDAVCYSITVGQGQATILNMGRTTMQPNSQGLTVISGMTVNAGASVIPRRNNQQHTLIVGGDIINNGTMIFTSSTTNGPVCNVTLNGSGSQTVGGNSPVLFNNLTIAATSTAVFITSGHSVKKVLLVNGTLDSVGNLTLLSTSAGTALIDGTGTGNVVSSIIMERYLSAGFGYKYLGSPFQNVTVAELGDDMDLTADFPTCFRYDENQAGSGWISHIVPTDILNPMSGYAVNFGSVLLPKTFDMQGVPNNGDLSVTLYNHNNSPTLGFNLISNPYPSPVDWNAAGWTKNNIDNALYYFRASTTDQYGGTYSSYVNGISSDGLATNVIPSMQGFFVHVSDGAYPVIATLGVSNAVRITDLTHVFLKSAPAAGGFLVRALAQYTDDTLSADPLVVYFDDMATDAFDTYYDALKLFNTDLQVTNFYTIAPDGKKLSVNSLPVQTGEMLEIPVGLITYRPGKVSFEVQAIENDPGTVSIYLHDTVTDTRVDLVRTAGYAVDLPAGSFSDRFSLVFLKSATGIDEHQAREELFSVYVTHDKLRAQINSISEETGCVTVYDLAGKAVFTRKVSRAGEHEFQTNLRPGLYLVRYASGADHCVKKVIIAE